jgi:HK97 family phage major capsid protein
MVSRTLAGMAGPISPDVGAAAPFSGEDTRPMALTLDNLSMMTGAQLRTAIAEIEVRLQDLHIDDSGEMRDLYGEERTEFDALTHLHDRARAHLRTRERLESGHGIERAYGSLNVMTRVNPWDGQDPMRITKQEARDKALAALERRFGTEHLSDRQRERVEATIRTDDANCDGSYVARRALLTENAAYRSAFARVMTQRHPILTTDEISALRAFEDFERTESRAMSEGVTTAGGFGVPVFLDATIVLTAQEAVNPFMELARQVPVTSNIWKGVNSAGVSWSFDSEGVEVSDDSPTLGQPSATVFMARGFIPYSIEVGQDYPGFAEEMTRILAAGYVDLEISKLTNGNGTTEPKGIVTQLSANAAVRVKLTTSGTLGVVDVYKAWEATPIRFRAGASWLSSVSVQDVIRQFGATYGSNFVVDLSEPVLSRLLGASYRVTDYMAASTTNTTANVPVAIVGDWSHFVVARRQGMTVEPVPTVFGTNGRPSGQRGFFGWARFGSTTDTDTAFRMLTNVT